MSGALPARCGDGGTRPDRVWVGGSRGSHDDDDINGRTTHDSVADQHTQGK